MNPRSRILDEPYAPNEMILIVFNFIGCILFGYLSNLPILIILYPFLGRCIGNHFPIVGDMIVNLYVWFYLIYIEQIMI